MYYTTNNNTNVGHVSVKKLVPCSGSGPQDQAHKANNFDVTNKHLLIPECMLRLRLRSQLHADEKGTNNVNAFKLKVHGKRYLSMF